MITIKNEFIRAEISEKGAELRSLSVLGKEYVWQADPEFWGKSCPILFPVCGGIKDEEAVIDGKVYKLPRHGFARDCIFELEEVTDTSASFLLRSSEKTLEIYPFNFEFRVKFALEKKSIRVTYGVKNLSNDVMYYSVGSHEGYSTPEGLEEYDIVFPEKVTLYSNDLEGALLGDTATLVIEDSNTLPLKTEYFEADTLIFRDIPVKSVRLRKKDGSREIKVSFPDFDHLMLWTVMGAKFICIEAWNGLSDHKDTDKNLKTKLGIKALSPSSSDEFTHSIEIVR
ncbi:MAG: aldose 1-epimerase family protein [Clostridia bacterium]|nr:aldose 1-epimerase family protein [Clostridia bacterium]